MEGNPSIYKGLYKWRVTLPFIKGFRVTLKGFRVTLKGFRVTLKGFRVTLKG